MRHTVTAEVFKSNSDNVLALRDFLKSGLGQNVMAALESAHPLRQLGDSRLIKGANNIRAAAVAEGDGGARAENILGRIEGFEAALDVLVSLSQLPKTKDKKSSKAGRDIAPVKLPKR